MANNTREMRLRIRSVQNTQQITRAMQMVASAKLHRSQERATASRPYTDEMTAVISTITQRTQGLSDPLLTPREVERVGYLLITSDQGLAGAYNANLSTAFLNDVRARDLQDPVVFVVGKKGVEFLRHRGMEPVSTVVDLPDYPSFHDVSEIAEQAVQLFLDHAYDALYLVYSKFVNTLVQRPTIQPLLPLTDLPQQQGGHGPKAEILYEPSAEEVLAALLPRYARTLIFNAVLEAKASEQAARMVAMKNATDNAQELIEQLQLQYNKARQAAITTQIVEISGGAEALRAMQQ